MKKYIKKFFVEVVIVFGFFGFREVFAQEPKISVVVPVYNTERYLPTCLDSLVNQNFRDIEIICVNDGSTDKSVAILNEYAKKDSRIRIINQENQGVSEARNTGIRESKGKYISFVDSDDYVDPKIYEKGYELIDSNDADVYSMKEETFYNGANLIKEKPYNSSKVFVYGDGEKTIDFPNKTYGIKLGVVWNKLYRKSLITDNNFKFEKDIYFGEDTIFNWILFTRVKKVINDENRLYFYRSSRPGSIMSTVDASKKIENYIAIARRLVEEYNTTNYFKGYENWVTTKILSLNYNFLIIRFPKSEEKIYWIKKFLKDVDEPYFKKYGFKDIKIENLRKIVKESESSNESSKTN
ncbi:MAG: glycosyltransferase [Clostridia bacterium]|nr:glycosyltransferase [Clostridia bacterium]